MDKSAGNIAFVAERVEDMSRNIDSNVHPNVIHRLMDDFGDWILDDPCEDGGVVIRLLPDDWKLVYELMRIGAATHFVARSEGD